jgi:hypothetical protein
MAAGGFQGTLTIKGTSTASGTISDNTFGRAHFVRIQTTSANNTITLRDIDSTIIGTLILVDNGDSIVIEKKPLQMISTSGSVVATAVGNPH